MRWRWDVILRFYFPINISGRQRNNIATSYDITTKNDATDTRYWGGVRTGRNLRQERTSRCYTIIIITITIITH
jgi:hypothetical protein